MLAAGEGERGLLLEAASRGHKGNALGPDLGRRKSQRIRANGPGASEDVYLIFKLRTRVRAAQRREALFTRARRSRRERWGRCLGDKPSEARCIFFQDEVETGKGGTHHSLERSKVVAAAAAAAAVAKAAAGAEGRGGAGEGGLEAGRVEGPSRPKRDGGDAVLHMGRERRLRSVGYDPLVKIR